MYDVLWRTQCHALSPGVQDTAASVEGAVQYVVAIALQVRHHH